MYGTVECRTCTAHIDVQDWNEGWGGEKTGTLDLSELVRETQCLPVTGSSGGPDSWSQKAVREVLVWETAGQRWRERLVVGVGIAMEFGSYLVRPRRA